MPKKILSISSSYIFLASEGASFYIGRDNWTRVENAIKRGRKLPEGKLITIDLETGEEIGKAEEEEEEEQEETWEEEEESF